MRYLAIESSSSLMSVAIGDETRMTEEVFLPRDVRQAAHLLKAIDQCCVKGRCTIKDIDRYAVSVGPGSFTGLRVGISTVKGLCFAYNKPVVAIDSLHVWSMPGLQRYSKVAVILDAKRGCIYGGAYHKHHDCLSTVVSPVVETVENFLKRLTAPMNYVFGGDFLLLYGARLEEALGIKPRSIDEELNKPLASSVLKIARKKFEQGDVCDYNILTPDYLWPEDVHTKPRL